MSRPQDQRTKERNARKDAALAEAAAKAQRRRLLVTLAVVGVLVLGTVVAVSQATSEDETASTTTVPGSSTTTRPGEPEPVSEVPLPPPGDTAPDGTCPPEEGGGTRFTAWPGPPPTCIATTADGTIDTAVDYRAILHTDGGDLTFFLNTEQGPVAVNDFVVLARSGYLDGAPIDTNTVDSWFEFGGRFEGQEAEGAGFTRPTETPEIGSLANPLALGLVSDDPADFDSTTSVGGRYLVVTGNGGASLPKRTTFFGLLLDGGDLYPRILRSATQSGVPGEVVTIESVTIEPITDDD